jgi:hypothetical protein
MRRLAKIQTALDFYTECDLEKIQKAQAAFLNEWESTLLR